MRNLSFMQVIFSLCLFSVWTYVAHSRIQWNHGKREAPPRSEESLENNQINEKSSLYLSPYIRNGQITEARRLAKVNNFLPDLLSYSGLITVDRPSCGSNMFFWFFPAEKNYTTAPLTVWLQGGPGSSSLFGLFNENGPMKLEEHGDEIKVLKRENSWTNISSMLYIDNPVGTGFSFTNATECYSRNQTHIAANLLTVMKEFLELFPELKQVDLFLTGQSYAGKYVPALAYAIHNDNKNSSHPIKLKGLALGNALVDPYNQILYGDMLYYLGLIDDSSRNVFLSREELSRKAINESDWIGAHDVIRNLILGPAEGLTYFRYSTNFDNIYNYLQSDRMPSSFYIFHKFVHEKMDDLHVTRVAGGEEREIIYETLRADIAKSTAPLLEELLEHYRVLIYTGQTDLIVNYPAVRNYLKKLNFSAASEYATAVRRPWYVGRELAGYSKSAGKLTEVLVRNAGHAVPMDQPKWAFDLFSRFVRNQTFWTWFFVN